jgi:hypothetical protein
MQVVSTARNARQKAETVVRKHVRYRCSQNLSVRYRLKGQDVMASGRCTVVSKGGIGALLSATQLEIGQDVILEITVSRMAATVALKARVKDRHGLSHGFEFLENSGRVTVSLKPLFQDDAVIFNMPAPAVPGMLSTKVAQRRHERVPATGDVTLVLQGGPAEVQIAARLVKVSQGGFQIAHNYAQLEAGRPATIVYAGVSIACHVVWNRAEDGQFECGLAVIDGEEQ